MRRLKPVQKRKVGEFRLIRCLGVDLTIVRLKKHMRRVEKGMYWKPSFRRIKMKVRRRQRAKKLASIAA